MSLFSNVYKKAARLLLGLRHRKVVPREFDARVGSSAELVARYIPNQPSPVKVSVGDAVICDERVVAHAPGKLTDGVRVVGEGRSIADDLSEDGMVNFSIEGKSPQGAEGELKACQILIERLNQQCTHWSDLRRPAREEGVDCEARDGERTLKIQVTRAEVEPRFWKELNEVGRLADRAVADEIADALRVAIDHKAIKASRDIVLALDATNTPRHAFGPVVDSFRERHGPWAARIGFKEIWVVGPIADLAARLDV